MSVNICFAFHSKAHNFGNFIKNVEHFYWEQWTLLSLHCHTTRTAGRRESTSKPRQYAHIGYRRLTAEGRLFAHTAEVPTDLIVDYRRVTVVRSKLFPLTLETFSPKLEDTKTEYEYEDCLLLRYKCLIIRYKVTGISEVSAASVFRG